MKKFLTIILVLVFFANALFAHGIKLTAELGAPYIIINASFSPTAPAVDAKVTIIDKGSDDIFQSGRTDFYGRFVFIPDKAGKWQIVVDDERGHKNKLDLQIADSFFMSEQCDSTIVDDPSQKAKIVNADNNCDHSHHIHFADIPMVYKIIFGLSIIFGITSFFYIIKSRKKN
jgi:hypothetical protein